MHGAMPLDGSNCSGQHHVLPQSYTEDPVCVPGQPEPGQGTWKVSSDEHPRSEACSRLEIVIRVHVTAVLSGVSELLVQQTGFLFLAAWDAWS